MKNTLFNQTLLKKYAKKFKPTYKQKETIREYIKMVEDGEFKAETKNYINFYDIILKEILGYERENVSFDEKVDDGIGRSEFVLKSGNNKFMVVELKGQDTDLDKKQTRKTDTRTPVDQAFGYAIHTGDVEWILLSNYDEFRLYNYHEKTKFISFNARELADNEILKQFLTVFSKTSHVDTDYINKIRQKTLVVESKLENNFYKLYNETRLMIIKELEHFNEFDRVKAVHYAQLILNRYMFICFAEDTELLPAQITIDTINRPIRFKDLRGDEIWHRINGLFRDVRDGNDERDVFPYDGALFDEDLKSIEIRDLIDDHKFFEDTYQKWNFEEYGINIKPLIDPYGDRINPIYKNLLTISKFDFSSDLDVNILGHIFENSIGDIEELKADAKGRRKKEGVFYTPEYITDYICRNTIIPYLSKSGKANTIKKLIAEYWGQEIDDLDKKVTNIKIVDPACGSGAFLNRAADLLLKIHKAIREQKYGNKYGLDKHLDSIEERKEIIVNNIYGVDVNEESVEITKLSLFLNIFKRDKDEVEKLKPKELPRLEDNIKCGNSIVDGPEYTNKPFKWEEEFKEIFEEGGFDIVIGNPPYVRHGKIKDIKPFLKENYVTYKGLSDLYVYFFEKGLKILKNNGKLGFITSNKFIKASYGEPLRKLILENTCFEKYIDHTWDKIFQEAAVHSSIIILGKSICRDNKILVNDDFELKQSRFNESAWGFELPEVLDLNDKINRNGVKIKDISELNFYIGVFTGYNDAFFIDENKKNEFISQDPRTAKFIKPLIRGKDIRRWIIDYQNLYLLYITWKFPLDDYPVIKKHLTEFKENLEKRYGVKGNAVEWFALERYGSDNSLEFEGPKLIFPEISPELFTVYDDSKFYTNNKCFIITSKTIDLKYLMTILSSKVLNFALKFVSSTLEGKRYNLSKNFIEKLPIHLATQEEQQPLIDKADQMLQLNKDLMSEIYGFKDWLKHTYKIEKFSKKLDKYYELTLDDFFVELKKKKVDIKSRKNYTVLKEEFEESINKINPLLDEISETNKIIDSMVYDLYGLTDEEIKIIEDS